MCAKLLHLCPALCDPMGCSPPGFSISWILQARILEWVTISDSNIYILYYIYYIMHYTIHIYIHYAYTLGFAKKFVHVSLYHLREKLKQLFWPTQYMCIYEYVCVTKKTQFSGYSDHRCLLFSLG